MVKVSVSIGYGGPRAEAVADSLDTFLSKRKLDVFFASPKGYSIPHGLSDKQQKEYIKKNFMESHIIVYVCHVETPTQPNVKDEIDFIARNNLNDRTIIFSKSDDCIPELAKDWWRPLHFSPEKPEDSFDRLLSEIFQQFTRLYKFEIKPEKGVP